MAQFNLALASTRSSHANAWTTMVHKAMLGDEVVIAYHEKPIIRLQPQQTERQSFAALSTALRALLVRLDQLAGGQGSAEGGQAIEQQWTEMCDDPLFRKLGVERPGGASGVASHATSTSGQVWPW
jgi:antitoxin (DNA-binding transcriptional repressor) of toxin-antitoxin stability system